MSLNKTGVQSKKPLGGGEETEASNTNHILYGLLVILIIVFFWKVSSDETGETMDIPGDKISVPHSFEDDGVASKDLNPNIEVEIEETEIPETKTGTSSSGVTAKKYATSSNINQKQNRNIDTDKNFPTSHYDNDSRKVDESYSYIYAAKVDMPQGTYRGLDQNGFAITKMRSYEERQNTEAYAGVNLTPIFEDRLGLSKITKVRQAEKKPTAVSKNNQYITYATTTKSREEYPNTGIHYGEKAYPLKDTLAWHPYESLPYLTEKKKIFVAEKVRAMPTVDDLEPNIHPSTLGDRDTRMGYGVVIRPGNR